MILSEELTPRDIETVLHRLNVDLGNGKDINGWKTIKSPLRDEKNPSFGINLQTGAWRDHATDEKGDIVTLTERIQNMDTGEAITWIKEQTDLTGTLYQPPTNGSKPKNKRTKKFWDSQRLLTLSEAQTRIKENPDHPVLQQAVKYDCLSLDTLQFFGVGLIEKWNNDWLAFPYETGCQLYRRENGKVIRSLKGSSPGESFFGSRKLTGDKKTLFIAKSPRESMLLYQLYGDRAEVVGIATGEQGKVSTKQIEWLKSQISKSNYSNIYVFLDCDSEAAKITAQSFTSEIFNTLASEFNGQISLVNIHSETGGAYKDITDCIRDGMDRESFNVMIGNAEEIELTKSTKLTKYRLDVSPEDLKLDESLIQLLPPVVKNYLNYSSPLSDVPNEFLLTPFLAVAGAAIGKNRYIEVGGMEEYPVIWTVLFAGSSTLRKSTALNLAKKPFKPIEDHYKKEYEQGLKRWQSEKEYAEDNDEPFDVPEPVKKTLYCSDGFSDLTFWEALRDNGSLISTPGEFTALWSELTRPRNSMRDLALSIFDAEDSIRRNTKSAGDIELQNPVWCMAGATTLTNFQRTLTSTERASGLLQRILPVCMEERTKQFRALTELQKPNPELYYEITKNTERLKDLEPRPVTISTEAEQLFTRWSHRLNDKAEELTDRLTDIGGFASRLNVYGLKFALIFQQLSRPNQPISRDNMKAAIALAEWLFNHILYMLDRNYIFNRHYADRLKVRELIQRQDNNIMKRTDLMNMSNFDKEQLDRALASDLDAGIIEEIKEETGGRPLVKYKLVTPT